MRNSSLALSLTAAVAFISVLSLGSSSQASTTLAHSSVTSAAAAPLFAADSDLRAHLTFQAPRVRELQATFSTPQVDNMANCDGTNRNGTPLNGLESPIDSVEVIVNKIINIGKSIWQVVKAGSPVVNLSVDRAHALPQGVQCWTDLSNWNMTQAKTYEVVYENLFGIEVVRLNFRVLATTGGNYKGQGQFITNATIVPTTVNVAWGYSLDAISTVPLVYNMGSQSEPVAAMQLDMKWRVSTALKFAEETENFVIQGTGALTKLK